MDLLIPGSGLIFWQALGFLALLFILGKFAWKPILSALEEREQSIATALEAAESAKTEMARLKADNEKLLEEARLERDRILRDAREAARRFEEAEVAKTSVKTAKLLEDARLAIQNEKNAALTDVRNQVAQLSLEITEKLLRAKLAEEPAQKALVNEFLKDLKLN
jgi:F-type H+-transporting ATPase subunit b